jgi:hypothetical protein
MPLAESVKLAAVQTKVNCLPDFVAVVTPLNKDQSHLTKRSSWSLITRRVLISQLTLHLNLN